MILNTKLLNKNLVMELKNANPMVVIMLKTFTSYDFILFKKLLKIELNKRLQILF